MYIIKYNIEFECKMNQQFIFNNFVGVFFASFKLTCIKKYYDALEIAWRPELLGRKLDFDGIHQAPFVNQA